MSFMDLDTDIRNYTVIELFQIIGISDDINRIDSTKPDIIHSNVNAIISKIRNSDDIEQDLKFDIIEFFHEVKRSLLEYMIKKDNERSVRKNDTNENKVSRYHSFIEKTSNELVEDKRIFFETLMKRMLQKTDTMNLSSSVLSRSGTINPLQKKYIKKIFNIDTLFRENYNKTSSTDFTQYVNPSLKNIMSMRLASIEIPNIWHMFNKKHKNNVIEITIFNFHDPDFNGSKITDPEKLFTRTYRIEIPNGNYTTDEFIYTINKILWNHDQDNPGEILPDTGFSGLRFIKFMLDPLTGETILTTIPQEETSIFSNVVAHRVNATAVQSNNPDGIPYNDMIVAYQSETTPLQAKTYSMESLHDSFAYEINFDPDNENIKKSLPFFNAGWFLGFRKNRYYVTLKDNIIRTDLTNEFTPNEHYYIRKGSIQSEGIFGSHFHYYLFLIVDDFQNNKYESVITNSDYVNDSNILARLTIKTNFNTIIYNNDDEHIYRKREYFGPVTIDKLNISIVDKFGRKVDIRDNNYSMSLEFEQEYV